MSLTSADWKSIEKELLATELYTLQVDLKLYQDWLARQVDPLLDSDLLWLFSTLHVKLSTFTPSHSRH